MIEKVLQCPKAITSGMLTRWFYGDEPGGGWSPETLSQHIETCSACLEEKAEITAQDKVLQEQFEADVFANAELAGVRHDPVLNGTEHDQSTEAEMDLITIFGSSNPAGKTRALVRTLQRRLAEPDWTRRKELITELADFARGAVEVSRRDFEQAMTMKRPNGLESYDINKEDTLPLIVQLLSHPESHVQSAQPILSIQGDVVIVNWHAWTEAASGVNR